MKIRTKVRFCLFAVCFALFFSVLCVFPINLRASSNLVDKWDISESDGDEVLATLARISDEKYELTIYGEGRMRSFSTSYPAPWSAYADLINSVVIKFGVENLSDYSINKCRFLETLTVENPYMEIASGVINSLYMTRVLCHRISTTKAIVYENNPNRLSYICEFENSACKICSYVCTSHIGGESTCETAAKCEICQAEYGEKRSHTPGEIVPEKPATCESDGIAAHRVCEYCSVVFNEIGDIVTEDELVIPSAHEYGELFECVKPSCTKEGSISYYECGRCGKRFDENYSEIDTVLIPPVGHVGGVATCTERAICEVCSLYYGTPDTQNHIFSSDMKYDTQNHWKECICGVVSEFSAHTYTETTLKEATEAENGVTLLSCECGYSTQRVEPKLPPSAMPEDTSDNKSKIMTVTLICGVLMTAGAVTTVLIFFKRKGKK